MKNPNVGVLVFSLIEAVGWATIAAIIATAIVGGPFIGHLFSVMAAQVAAAGLGYGFVEHVVAYNVPKARPWFQFPLQP